MKPWWRTAMTTLANLVGATLIVWSVAPSDPFVYFGLIVGIMILFRNNGSSDGASGH